MATIRLTVLNSIRKVMADFPFWFVYRKKGKEPISRLSFSSMISQNSTTEKSSIGKMLT